MACLGTLGMWNDAQQIHQYEPMQATWTSQKHVDDTAQSGDYVLTMEQHLETTTKLQVRIRGESRQCLNTWFCTVRKEIAATCVKQDSFNYEELEHQMTGAHKQVVRLLNHTSAESPDCCFKAKERGRKTQRPTAERWQMLRRFGKFLATNKQTPF